MGPLFSLLHSCGAFLTDIDIGISDTNYDRRSTIFGFDLTASLLPPGQTFEMDKDKGLQLILRTSTPIEDTVNVVIYAEYDAEIEYTSDRRIIKHRYA